jgi:glutamate racemase
MTAPDAPIGVFDSGVGGVSVLREIRRALPLEPLLYVADSAYAPYGEQSDEVIRTRSTAITEFLIGRSAKAIVVACNTATSFAAETLRARFELPIVAMEPALKPAAQSTKTTVVGVLATTRTLESERFMRLQQAYGTSVRVLVQPCPGLVEGVERGDLSGPDMLALVRRYVEPLVQQEADTLVLGCTHYPFLIPIIREVAGPTVKVIDPAPAVARELRRRLALAGLLQEGDSPGREHFWTSGDPAQVIPVMTRLWGKPVEVRQLPVGARGSERTRPTPDSGTDPCRCG